MLQHEFDAAIGGREYFTKDEYIIANAMYESNHSWKDNKEFLQMYAQLPDRAVIEMQSMFTSLQNACKAISQKSETIKELHKTIKHIDKDMFGIECELDKARAEIKRQQEVIDRLNKNGHNFKVSRDDYYEKVKALKAELEIAKASAKDTMELAKVETARCADIEVDSRIAAELLSHIIHDYHTDFSEEDEVAAMTACINILGRKKYLKGILPMNRLCDCDLEILHNALNELKD